jgi:hypothetical protein
MHRNELSQHGHALGTHLIPTSFLEIENRQCKKGLIRKPFFFDLSFFKIKISPSPESLTQRTMHRDGLSQCGDVLGIRHLEHRHRHRHEEGVVVLQAPWQHHTEIK